MIKVQLKQNPKALDLESLETSTSKVTLGFKCNPDVKLALANDAHVRGLTLSEYVENLVSDLNAAQRSSSLQIQALRDKIAFYENDFILELFKRYRGTSVPYKDDDDVDYVVDIKEPKDIFLLVIKSFRICRL